MRLKPLRTQDAHIIVAAIGVRARLAELDRPVELSLGQRGVGGTGDLQCLGADPRARAPAGRRPWQINDDGLPRAHLTHIATVCPELDLHGLCDDAGPIRGSRLAKQLDVRSTDELHVVRLPHLVDDSDLGRRHKPELARSGVASHNASAAADLEGVQVGPLAQRHVRIVSEHGLSAGLDSDTPREAHIPVRLRHGRRACGDANGVAGPIRLEELDSGPRLQVQQALAPVVACHVTVRRHPAAFEGRGAWHANDAVSVRVRRLGRGGDQPVAGDESDAPEDVHGSLLLVRGRLLARERESAPVLALGHRHCYTKETNRVVGIRDMTLRIDRQFFGIGVGLHDARTAALDDRIRVAPIDGHGLRGNNSIPDAQEYGESERHDECRQPNPGGTLPGCH